MIVQTNTALSFGEFQVDPDRRLLLRNGEVVPLKAKAFDLLTVFLEKRGEVLTKNELLDTVWENQFVEENNLTVHVAALRKALGEKKNENRYIVTVPGKGYRFVAELHPAAAADIVVESITLERIVVDTYEVTETHSEPSKLWNSRTAPFWLAIPAALLILAGTWFGYSRWNEVTAEGSSQTVLRNFSTSGIPQRVAISNDGKLLAYVRRLNGKDSIWVGDLETNANMQITPESNRLHEAITFSADARTIYLLARDANHNEPTLMSVPTLGGAVKDLVAGAQKMSISPGGREIAYLKKDPDTRLVALYTADAATGANERLLFAPEKPMRLSDQSVSWSPLDNAVTVGLTDENGKGCDLANIATADGSVSRFGKDQCGDSRNFEWLKDGSGLILTIRGADDLTAQIWAFDIRLGDRRRVTNDATSYGAFSLSTSANGHIVALAVRNYPSVWLLGSNAGAQPQRLLLGSGRGEGATGLVMAPDGKLLYTLRTDRSRGVWEMSVDGSDQRELIPPEKEFQNEQVSVTPDNSHLVFESDRTGTTEIWRANRDGSGAIALTSGGGNSAPALTPDGDTIMYVSRRDGVYGIWSIPISGSPPHHVMTSECSWPDVSPDGKRLACVTGTASDPSKRKLVVYDLSNNREVSSFDLAVNAAPYNRIRWSPDGSSIVYKDVVDGLWKQDVGGGKPEKLPGFVDERVFHFNFSNNGDLIYSGGVQMRQIVVIENFK